MPPYSLTKHKKYWKEFFKWTFLLAELERGIKVLQFDCCEADQNFNWTGESNQSASVWCMVYGVRYWPKFRLWLWPLLLLQMYRWQL